MQRSETTDSCSLVPFGQANISSCPARKQTWPSTTTALRFGSSQTSLVLESLTSPCDSAVSAGCAAGAVAAGSPDLASLGSSPDTKDNRLATATAITTVRQ